MNILTFDIEEWYVYQLYPKGGTDYYLPIINSYLDQLLDLLDEKNAKATFFCLGMVAKEYPEVIRKISKKDHEIACHSHLHKFIFTLTPEQFFDDTKIAIDLIENITGNKVKGYRAPAFSLTEENTWAFDILCNFGIEYDSSIFPSKRSFGGFPAFKESKPVIIKRNNNTIKEFPISIGNVGGLDIGYSGGGYFRLIPYKKIKKMASSSDYVMSYFHIRDFDAKQKRVISTRYFYSYYGIKRMLGKFNYFLNDFKFENIATVDKLIDWEKATVIQF